MSQQKNKTLKRTHLQTQEEAGQTPNQPQDSLRSFLDAQAEAVYNRPWHRLERGFRMNRLRRFADEEAKKLSLSDTEVQQLVVVLTKALDKRLLNTKSTVIYDQDTGDIKEIKGLIMHRAADGKITFQMLEKKGATTMRKRATTPAPAVSDTASSQNKIEPAQPKPAL
jgi:hypothetical protein